MAQSLSLSKRLENILIFDHIFPLLSMCRDIDSLYVYIYEI